MKFTEKELALIAAANKKSSDAALKRKFILALMLIGLVLTGIINYDQFAYAAVAAVFLSIAMSQLGCGPQYEDLVRLLEAKSKAHAS
jgi:hypothetical protein